MRCFVERLAINFSLEDKIPNFAPKMLLRPLLFHFDLSLIVTLSFYPKIVLLRPGLKVSMMCNTRYRRLKILCIVNGIAFAIKEIFTVHKAFMALTSVHWVGALDMRSEGSFSGLDLDVSLLLSIYYLINLTGI